MCTLTSLRPYKDVGNKAAVFPLQLLGFDVDFINSVHFSNHTGYENGLTGDVLNGDQLREVMRGLEDNNLLDDVGYMLTGYMGSVSFCEAVLGVLKTLRAQNSKVTFVCDPVRTDAVYYFYVY
jgi:pyridoxine kinase